MVSAEYRPTEAEFIGCWARAAEQAGRDPHTAETEARRGIAKIKAEAKSEGLREAADVATEIVGVSEITATWLRLCADQIEKEAQG